MRRRSLAKLPPGPRMPSIVQLVRLYRDPIGFITSQERRYGELFTIRFPGGENALYITDPELAREAFATDKTIGLAGAGRARFLEPVVGESSLLTLDGPEWERHRHLLVPPFHGERIERFEDRIAELAAAEAETWSAGEMAMRPAMTRITLEVILRVVFGIAEGEHLDRLRERLPTMIDAGARYAWLPPKLRDRLERGGRRLPARVVPGGRFVRLREQVNEVLYAEIGARRAEPDLERRDDVLSMLICARDEDGGQMSDRELRDELIGLLVAGHETTATGLAWAFERLSRHAHALDRLTAEVDAGQDTYLDAVVKETLRTRPVVFDVVRIISEPFEIGGYEIPAGWYLAPGIAAIHHRAADWPDPWSFRPERFSDQRPNLRAWIPFGGGRRFCIGSHLALMEMRTILREILLRVSVEATDAPAERARAQHVTIQPARGAVVTVEPRRVRARGAAPARRTEDGHGERARERPAPGPQTVGARDP